MKPRALIIGGGPAGLSAGIALARAGYDAEVHEQRPEWKGRVCGSFMNPDAVRALEWLGLFEEARRRGAVPITETEVVAPGGRHSLVPTVQDGTPSLAFQRHKLEDMLVEELERVGGRLVLGSRVVRVTRRGSEWIAGTRQGDFFGDIQAQLLVRAGGRFSEEPVPRAGGWYGWNALFSGVSQSPGEMSMYFGRRGYAGVLTFSDGTTNICGLTHRPAGEHAPWENVFLDLQNEQPDFRKLTAGARRLDDWHGVGPLPFTSRVRYSEDAILAGDAGAVGDPFMGEGIGRALATAPLLAAAIEKAASGGAVLDHYRQLWREAYSQRLTIGWAARWLLERPWIMSPLISGLLRPAVISRATPLFHRGGGFTRVRPASRPS